MNRISNSNWGSFEHTRMFTRDEGSIADVALGSRFSGRHITEQHRGIVKQTHPVTRSTAFGVQFLINHDRSVVIHRSKTKVPSQCGFTLVFFGRRQGFSQLLGGWSSMVRAPSVCFFSAPAPGGGL